MQPQNGDYLGTKGQLAAWQEEEDLAQFHERITEPQAHFIAHHWALSGRTPRTQLLRFYLVADVPKAEIVKAWGISRQAIEKQQRLLEAERGRWKIDEKSLSRKVDYEWALTATKCFTQLLRFYILSRWPTAVIQRGLRIGRYTIMGLGVSKQAISKQRKLWREYRRAHGLDYAPPRMAQADCSDLDRYYGFKPAPKKKQPSPPCDPPV